jgi:hypothetical protein
VKRMLPYIDRELGECRNRIETYRAAHLNCLGDARCAHRHALMTPGARQASRSSACARRDRRGLLAAACYVEPIRIPAG